MTPLPYTQWPKNGSGNPRIWTVRDKHKDVGDLDETDELNVSIDSSGMIKISAFTCSHSGAPPPHDAREWKDRDCSAITSNKVRGTTFSGRDFEIVSSEVDDENGNRHNRLTCSVINPRRSEAMESTAGGVCWTAEDG